jgi:hypothetical protein
MLPHVVARRTPPKAADDEAISPTQPTPAEIVKTLESFWRFGVKEVSREVAVTRILLSVVVTTLLISSFTNPAEARPGGRYSIEFAVMPSMVFSRVSYPRNCLYGYCTEHVQGRFADAPYQTPYLQLSLWSDPYVAVDFAMQAIHQPSGAAGQAQWYELYEVGGSLSCGLPRFRLQPYLGPAVGYIVSHPHHVRPMIAARTGVRYFLSERLALRAEWAYRETFQDKGDDWHAFGFSAGLGFFP